MSDLLKTGLIASIFALGAMAMPVQAGERERERDANGLYIEPLCDYASKVKNSLENLLEQVPTGLKASNDKWEMEIYSSPETKGWTLVGKSKAPDANPYKLCRLASGQQSPYDQEKWFALNFNPSAPKETPNNPSHREGLSAK